MTPCPVYFIINFINLPIIYLLNDINVLPFVLLCAVNRFGELIRKIWNPRNFKAHVSPHEMLQVNIAGSCTTVLVVLVSRNFMIVPVDAILLSR